MRNIFLCRRKVLGAKRQTILDYPAKSWFVGLLHFFVATALIACTDAPRKGAPAGPTDVSCVAGEFELPDGKCQPAGLPLDMPCPPGDMRLDNGACQKAGVPASMCAKGFQPDGNDGCKPILPANACAAGQMAVPGETTCHDVAPCGNETWGDIPSEANTEYVDQAYPGNDSNGSKVKPWTTIGNAISAAENGAIVAIAAGSYKEDVVIEGKPVRLWGRCPAMVNIVGTDVEDAAVQVFDNAASGSEIHGIAVTGPHIGISVHATTSIVIDAAWVHETGQRALDIVGSDKSGALVPTSATVNHLLVEQSHGEGINLGTAEATIENTVVRATQPNADGSLGTGVLVIDDGKGAPANGTLRNCVVEQNHNAGMLVFASSATIEGTVVRTTMPDANKQFGMGISIAARSDPKARASATIRGSFVETNTKVGVHVWGSDATIEGTVIRDTQPIDGDWAFGYGVNVMNDENNGEPSIVTIQSSLIEQNISSGMLVFGSVMTIEGTVIRDTAPDAMGKFGRGVDVENVSPTKVRPSVTLRGSIVERNHDVGVIVGGADAIIEATVIRDTTSDPSMMFVDGDGIIVRDRGTVENGRANATIHGCILEHNQRVGALVVGSDATIEATEVRATMSTITGNWGNGIYIANDTETLERASVIVRSCLVEQNHYSGVMTSDSDITIEASMIRDALPADNGAFGDGISAVRSNAKIVETVVTGNARAGVASFGAHVEISGGIFECNGFNLEGEADSDIPFSFAGSTGWQCGQPTVDKCTEIAPDCKVSSSGLEPPPPLPPLPPF